MLAEHIAALRTTTARHLHGKIERIACCLKVKASSESASAVASNVYRQSLTAQQSARLAQPAHTVGGSGTPSGRGCHLQGRSAPLSWTIMKIGASHTLSLTPLPLTSPSPTLHRWVPSHSARPYLAPTVRKVGPSRSPHVRSRCSQARVSQTQPSAEQERSMCAIWLPRVLVRKHKAYSKQRRSRLWSKQVNVRTCGLHYLLALSICGCVRVSELRICPYLAISGYSRITSYSRL